MDGPWRNPHRLRNFDYSTVGAYFITICCLQRQHLFGNISDGRMWLSSLGRLAHNHLLLLPSRHSHIMLDCFVVMPNHLHALLVIPYTPELQSRLLPITKVVGYYKSGVTTQWRMQTNDPSALIWQRSFDDRVVRNEEGLNAYRQYIIDNVRAWELDKENAARLGLNSFYQRFDRKA